MGALAQLQAQAKTFTAGDVLGRWIQSEINRLSVDEAVPAVAAAKNSAWDVAQATHTSGNMTLTFTIRQNDGTYNTFTTGNIAYNAGAAAVLSAIDAAAIAASYPGWTNNISVNGTAINHPDNIDFAFAGSPVAGRPATVVLTDVDGAGGAWGAVTKTTRGQSERPALAVLLNYGILDAGTIAEQDVASSQIAFAKGTGSESQRVPAVIVKRLMKEAAAEDANNGIGISLEAVLSPQDRAPSVQPRTTQDGIVRAFDV